MEGSGVAARKQAGVDRRLSYHGQRTTSSQPHRCRLLPGHARSVDGPSRGNAGLRVPARGILATIDWWIAYDWEAARRRLEHAVVLGPSSATAHDYLANVFATVGRFDEALRASELACAHDPVNNFITANAALCLYRARRHEEAVAAFRRERTLDPNPPMARGLIGLPLVQLGRLDEACAEMRSS